MHDVPLIFGSEDVSHELEAGQEMDHVDEDEIEERDVTAEEQHRDDDDQGGIGQLLVLFIPFSFGSQGQEAFCSSSRTSEKKLLVLANMRAVNR